MHGESTQALSGASSAAGYEARGPSQRGLGRLVRRWYQEEDEETNKGLAARRTVRQVRLS